jgi:hypothetical protein
VVVDTAPRPGPWGRLPDVLISSVASFWTLPELCSWIATHRSMRAPVQVTLEFKSPMTRDDEHDLAKVVTRFGLQCTKLVVHRSSVPFDQYRWQSLPNLRELSLHVSHISLDSVLKHCGHTLQRLYVRTTGLQIAGNHDALCAALSKATRLTELQLPNSYTVVDTATKAMRFVSSLPPTLTKLCVCNLSISHSWLSVLLRQCPNLVDLDLSITEIDARTMQWNVLAKEQRAWQSLHIQLYTDKEIALVPILLDLAAARPRRRLMVQSNGVQREAVNKAILEQLVAAMGIDTARHLEVLVIANNATAAASANECWPVLLDYFPALRRCSVFHYRDIECRAHLVRAYRQRWPVLRQGFPFFYDGPVDGKDKKDDYLDAITGMASDFLEYNQGETVEPLSLCPPGASNAFLRATQSWQCVDISNQLRLEDATWWHLVRLPALRELKIDLSEDGCHDLDAAVLDHLMLHRKHGPQTVRLVFAASTPNLQHIFSFPRLQQWMQHSPVRALIVHGFPLAHLSEDQWRTLVRLWAPSPHAYQRYDREWMLEVDSAQYRVLFPSVMWANVITPTWVSATTAVAGITLRRRME